MTPFTLGIVGATGAVGQAALDLLAQKDGLGLGWVGRVRAFASHSSAGSTLPFGAGHLVVEGATPTVLGECHALLFATEAPISRELIPPLAAKGVLCVDKSSSFRADPRVPLVVPEVNGGELDNPRFATFPVVANPNCCATPLTVALAPLLRHFGIRRVVVSTYQSVSGAGKQGLMALDGETKASLEIHQGDTLQPPLPGDSPFPKPIAFNVMPFVASISPEGHTDEEEKICAETQKILGVEIPMGATSVRVPSRVGHGLSVSVELGSHPGSLDEVIRALQGSLGIAYGDLQGNAAGFMTPREAQGTWPVWVSRVRTCGALPNGVSFWIVADNLLKGAALNALQIVSYVKKNTGFFSPPAPQKK